MWKKNTGTDTKTESSSGEFDTSKDIVVVTREEGSGTRGGLLLNYLVLKKKVLMVKR